MRCVILGVFLLLALAGILAGWSAALIVPVLGALGLLEFFFLPELLEHFAVRRAGASGRPVDSIWFVDRDKIAAQERERFERQTEDNPTLR